MKETSEGMPEIGSGTRMLGARPGIDVPAQNSIDMVKSGQGGMSVSPDDPVNLPVYRRPFEFGGTGKDPIWSIVDGDLKPALRYRPDPKNPDTHGFIEPALSMTLKEYQDALANTQGHWKKFNFVSSS